VALDTATAVDVETCADTADAAETSATVEVAKTRTAPLAVELELAELVPMAPEVFVPVADEPEDPEPVPNWTDRPTAVTEEDAATDAAPGIVAPMVVASAVTEETAMAPDTPRPDMEPTAVLLALDDPVTC
jgi:hypothetical protein